MGEKVQLLIVGDSHSIFNFGGVAEAKIYHVPGVTMHRAARDGIKSIIPEHCEPKAGDTLILSLGEIDSRAQIPKHARLNSTSVLAEADALCDRFEIALNAFRKECPVKVAMCCIIPFNPYSLSHDFYSSHEEAVSDARSIRQHMNDRMKNMGVPFLDIRPDFSNPDGTLIPSKSDATLHLDPRISAPMLEELKRALGESFSSMDPPWPNAFPRAETTRKDVRRKARKDFERGVKQVFLLVPGAPSLRTLYKSIRRK